MRKEEFINAAKQKVAELGKTTRRQTKTLEAQRDNIAPPPAPAYRPPGFIQGDGNNEIAARNSYNLKIKELNDAARADMKRIVTTIPFPLTNAEQQEILLDGSNFLNGSIDQRLDEPNRDTNPSAAKLFIDFNFSAKDVRKDPQPEDPQGLDDNPNGGGGGGNANNLNQDVGIPERGQLSEIFNTAAVRAASPTIAPNPAPRNSLEQPDDLSHLSSPEEKIQPAEQDMGKTVNDNISFNSELGQPIDPTKISPANVKTSLNEPMAGKEANDNIDAGSTPQNSDTLGTHGPQQTSIHDPAIGRTPNFEPVPHGNVAFAMQPDYTPEPQLGAETKTVQEPSAEKEVANDNLPEREDREKNHEETAGPEIEKQGKQQDIQEPSYLQEMPETKKNQFADVTKGEKDTINPNKETSGPRYLQEMPEQSKDQAEMGVSEKDEASPNEPSYIQEIPGTGKDQSTDVTKDEKETTAVNQENRQPSYLHETLEQSKDQAEMDVREKDEASPNEPSYMQEIPEAAKDQSIDVNKDEKETITLNQETSQPGYLQEMPGESKEQLQMDTSEKDEISSNEPSYLRGIPIEQEISEPAEQEPTKEKLEATEPPSIDDDRE